MVLIHAVCTSSKSTWTLSSTFAVPWIAFIGDSATDCLSIRCRESHAAVLVAEENKLLVFGGNGAPLRPAKGATAKAGANASPTANKGEAGAKPEADAKPEPRPAAASTYLADLWSLDLETWTWCQLKPKGQVRINERQAHSCGS